MCIIGDRTAIARHFGKRLEGADGPSSAFSILTGCGLLRFRIYAAYDPHRFAHDLGFSCVHISYYNPTFKKIKKLSKLSWECLANNPTIEYIQVVAKKATAPRSGKVGAAAHKTFGGFEMSIAKELWDVVQHRTGANRLGWKASLSKKSLAVWDAVTFGAFRRRRRVRTWRGEY